MSDDSSPHSLSRRDLLFGFANGLRKNVETLAVAAGVAAEPAADVAAQPNVLAQSLTEAQRAYDADDLQTAVGLLRDCIRIDLDHAPARLLLGYCLFRRGAYIQARVEFDRVLRIQPNDTLAALYGGLTHARLGKLETALQYWRDASWTDPELREFLLEQAAKLENPAPEDNDGPDASQAPETAAGDPIAAIEAFVAARGQALLPPPVALA
jgi:tetratricopeptide (TPR) repeat protein